MARSCIINANIFTPQGSSARRGEEMSVLKHFENYAILIEDGIGIRVSTLRKGGAARIQMEERTSILCRQLLRLQKMGMTMQQCIALHQWRKLRLIEKMPMGRKNRMTVQCEDRIIRHHRELQHYLIDLRLTVATYRPDSVLQRIQHRDDLLRCILLRKVVTWSVIEDVSEEDQALCAALLELLQGPAAPVCRAVDITCNEIFHILSSPLFSITSALVHRIPVYGCRCSVHGRSASEAPCSSPFPSPAGSGTSHHGRDC